MPYVTCLAITACISCDVTFAHCIASTWSHVIYVTRHCVTHVQSNIATGINKSCKTVMFLTVLSRYLIIILSCLLMMFECYLIIILICLIIIFDCYLIIMFITCFSIVFSRGTTRDPLISAVILHTILRCLL